MKVLALPKSQLLLQCRAHPRAEAAANLTTKPSRHRTHTSRGRLPVWPLTARPAS